MPEFARGAWGQPCQSPIMLVIGDLQRVNVVPDDGRRRLAGTRAVPSSSSGLRRCDLGDWSRCVHLCRRLQALRRPASQAWRHPGSADAIRGAHHTNSDTDRLVPEDPVRQPSWRRSFYHGDARSAAATNGTPAVVSGLPIGRVRVHNLMTPVALRASEPDRPGSGRSDSQSLG
jgi:hypothetical protein